MNNKRLAQNSCASGSGYLLWRNRLALILAVASVLVHDVRGQSCGTVPVETITVGTNDSKVGVAVYTNVTLPKIPRYLKQDISTAKTISSAWSNYTASPYSYDYTSYGVGWEGGGVQVNLSATETTEYTNRRSSLPLVSYGGTNYAYTTNYDERPIYRSWSSGYWSKSNYTHFSVTTGSLTSEGWYNSDYTEGHVFYVRYYDHITDLYDTWEPLRF